MFQSDPVIRISLFSLFHRSAVFMLLAIMLVASGCGSTKVYTANKTIVYGGEIYNMSTVQRIGSRVTGTLSNSDTVNMRTLDKKAVQDLLKEHSTILVTQVVEMDGQEMIYRNSRVSKYSEYSSMMKKFDGALNDITKFMADKKKTQLKLK